MKKIGIITYHRANNVGAVLQNHALQITLRKYCDVETCDVETVDYRNVLIEQSNRIFTKKTLKEYVKLFVQLGSYIKREYCFNCYRKKYLKISEKRYTQKNIFESENEYDFFITGSDQVWNLSLNHFDYNYYLEFVSDADKCRAYAGSFGNFNFDKEALDKAIKLLKRFKYVTVREVSAKDFLERSGISAVTVLDPTLLIDGTLWKRELELKEEKKANYVFVYMVAYTPMLISKAKEYARRNNLSIMVMHYGYKKISGVRNLRAVSPKRFLEYLLNSDIVFSSSFHAICFSILFKKEFVFALDKSKVNNNSRIESLCSRLSLMNREVESVNYEEKISYGQVYEVLNDERKRSLVALMRMVDAKE